MNGSLDLRGLKAVLCAAALAAGLSTAGCSGSQAPERSPSPARRTAPSGASRAGAAVTVTLESHEAHEAQRAWCRYLEALYLRATNSSASWPRFDECTHATTTAAPDMLRRTAECSMKALATFDGDPLTPAYAAQVRRCGAEALDASAASNAEVERLVSVVCERAQACGAGNDADCRARLLSSQDGPRLGRAIGAISPKSRQTLRACVSRAGCDDLDTLVERCLEPIMDQLLWLPE